MNLGFPYYPKSGSESTTQHNDDTDPPNSHFNFNGHFEAALEIQYRSASCVLCVLCAMCNYTSRESKVRSRCRACRSAAVGVRRGEFRFSELADCGCGCGCGCGGACCCCSFCSDWPCSHRKSWRPSLDDCGAFGTPAGGCAFPVFFGGVATAGCALIISSTR